jgi:hypothetical protein
MNPRNTRILVVDALHDGADGLAALLDAMGYEARAAYSREDALARAAAWRPHAAIIDVSDWPRALAFAGALAACCDGDSGGVYGVSVVPRDAHRDGDGGIRAVFLKGHPIDGLVARLREDLSSAAR